MNIETCETCVHYKLLWDDSDEFVCQRHPPVVDKGTLGAYPRVARWWRCGEYESARFDRNLEGADEVWAQYERLGGEDNLNCLSCVHFQSTSSMEGEGECRFSPPVFRNDMPGMHAQWPVVYEHDWCARIKYRVE